MNCAKGCGGTIGLLKSVLAETFVSMLLSPIMMLIQSRVVADVMIGRDSGWNAQNRDDQAMPFKACARIHASHVVAGLAFGVLAFHISWATFLARPHRRRAGALAARVMVHGPAGLRPQALALERLPHARKRPRARPKTNWPKPLPPSRCWKPRSKCLSSSPAKRERRAPNEVGVGEGKCAPTSLPCSLPLISPLPVGNGSLLLPQEKREKTKDHLTQKPSPPHPHQS